MNKHEKEVLSFFDKAEKTVLKKLEAEYKEGTKIALPEIEEGYHYTDGVNNYNSGDIYEVTGEAVLTVELNTYDVTIDGEVAGTVTFTPVVLVFISFLPILALSTQGPYLNATVFSLSGSE